MSLDELVEALKGGAGSGNFGHAGIPGKVGGSSRGAGGGTQIEPEQKQKNLNKVGDYIEAGKIESWATEPFDRDGLEKTMNAAGWKISRRESGYVISKATRIGGDDTVFLAHNTSWGELHANIGGKNHVYKFGSKDPRTPVPSKSHIVDLLRNGALPSIDPRDAKN